MNRIILLSAVGMLLGLAPVTRLMAMDILTTEELAVQCLDNQDSTPSPGAGCMAYLRGFIDGAIATDPAVTMNVARELEEQETFSERALRTRVGSRLDRYGPSFFAEFCISLPVPLAEIGGHVLTSLAEQRGSQDPARDTVYQVLKRHYPCE